MCNAGDLVKGHLIVFLINFFSEVILTSQKSNELSLNFL